MTEQLTDQKGRAIRGYLTGWLRMRTPGGKGSRWSGRRHVLGVHHTYGPHLNIHQGLALCGVSGKIVTSQKPADYPPVSADRELCKRCRYVAERMGR